MLLYRSILLVLTPVIFIHLIVRSLKCGEWRYFWQRLGFGYDDIPGGSVWVHCASVGEVRTVLPLLEQLHRDAPELRFLITSNTATSRSVLSNFDADWIDHQYCPIDWRLAVSRFLRKTRPVSCFLFETELWPNLVRVATRSGIRVSIINGRLSDKSMQRTGLLRRLYAPVFDDIRSIHARNDIDRDRFITLGADADTTLADGDLKLAGIMPDKPRSAARTERPYVLIVSTHDDEELQICRHCRNQMAEHLFVIAPRHPERAGAVHRQLKAEGLEVSLHSEATGIGTEDVHLIDAIGLLDDWFPHARCVIMGGTFIDRGGHNLMEPLTFGRALVYGPSIENFVEMDEIVQQHDAALQVESYEQLDACLQRWLPESDERQGYEDRADRLTASLSSTLEHYSALIRQQLQTDE